MAEKPKRKSGMYEQIRANVWRSRVLMLLLLALLACAGYFRYRASGNAVAGLLTIALIGVFVAYFYHHTDDLLLRISGAVPAGHDRYPHYVNCIAAVSIGAGIPPPKPYVILDRAPSSFAVGRDPDHAAVVVTTGLITLMKRDELEVVVGHEIAHIAACDIRLATLTAAIGWAIETASLSWTMRNVVEMAKTWWLKALLTVAFLTLAIGACTCCGPHALCLVVIITFAVFICIWIWARVPRMVTDCLRICITRQRDFLADANAALFTRHPKALIRALTKLEKNQRILRRLHPVLIPLLIHHPGSERNGWLGALFATHPPMEERIRRLKDMSQPVPLPVRPDQETDDVQPACGSQDARKKPIRRRVGASHAHTKE